MPRPGVLSKRESTKKGKNVVTTLSLFHNVI